MLNHVDLIGNKWIIMLHNVVTNTVLRTMVHNDCDLTMLIGWSKFVGWQGNLVSIFRLFRAL